MKKKLLTICLFVLSFVAVSQPYGNEWINYSQKYYFFKISSDGVYRINAAALSSANIPAIDHRNFQLFGRGEELFIYVEDLNSNNIIDGNDFIEFYAQKNDGFLDSLVYDDPLSQSNPYYSLFNDTALYYLTWNSLVSNKRMTPETDTNFGAFSASPYFFKETVITENSTYLLGETSTPPDTDPMYTKTEGWFDEFGLGTNLFSAKTKSITTNSAYTSGPPATFKSVIVGASNTSGIDHHITVTHGSGNVLLTDTLFDGYQQIKLISSIPAASLNSSVTDFKYTTIAGNRAGIAYTYLKFPHVLNLGNATTFKMLLPDNTQGGQVKAHLPLSGFNDQGSTARLYDLTNGIRATVIYDAGFQVHQALVPNSGSEKECYITSDNQIQNIPFLLPVSPTAEFIDFLNSPPDSAYIIITHKSLMPAADFYKFYRSTPNGGSHNVILVDIDELYHQFAFGIFKNPLSIRRFADFALDNWTTPPQNLFIIGKSINAQKNRKNSIYFANTLVPSFGLPTSDALLTAGLNGTLYEMAIPTGRLAAKNNTEVQSYLSKMMEYEYDAYNPVAPETIEWMKNVLHFVGGNVGPEQDLLENYMLGFENTIEDTLFGGHVFTFMKNSTAPIVIALSDSIKFLMNRGVSLLTFFGHASGSSFDISLEHPSAYSNEGKYPFVIANACLTGDIHLPFATPPSSSESFVLEPNKGSIGYLAVVSQGFPNMLNQYTSQIYKNIGQDYYGKSMGIAMKQAVVSIQQPNSPYLKGVCLQMTLHGDPALKINSHESPDIMISQPNVYFTPGNVTTEVDSFKLNVILTNLGRATSSPFGLEVFRVFPDGSSDTATTIVQGLNYKDTITFTFPVDFVKGPGLNQFNIFADNTSLIDELSEMNNYISVNLTIRSTDIVPVYPYEYAVVPNQGVTLKANTLDPFAPMRNYILELDTTDLYNSNLKQTISIAHSGGVVNWKPSLLEAMPDSTVYFWRASPLPADPLDSSKYRWRESTFQYITGKRGWGQAHFFQYKNDKYNFLDYNRPLRKFIFSSAAKSLICTNIGSPLVSELSGIEYKLDTDLQDYAGCSYSPAIHIVVIDSTKLLPWETYYNAGGGIIQNPNNDFDNANNNRVCRGWRNDKYFIFRLNDPVQVSGMLDMLNNKVPNGNYILAYSYRYSLCQQWNIFNTAIHTTFNNLSGNATNLSTVGDSIPFIFFVKKGYPSSHQEVIGDSSRAVINFNTPIVNNFPYGEITTDLIGPSTKWGSFHWRQSPLENPTKDSISVNVIGVKLNGVEDVLVSFPKDSIDVLDLNAHGVDAATYPYLKLNTYMMDDSLQTAPQMNRWQVLYEPVPEAALNASLLFSFYADTLQEGEEVKFKVAVQNISEFDMDSINISYWVEDAGGNIHSIYYGKQKPLPADSVLISSVNFSTKGYPGINSLWIEVNPEDQNWQLEQYHFNNIAQLGFFVGKDNTNPLLDITFDAVHILDGDIVSPKPLIGIQLTDENKFLLLNEMSDTSHFAVYIKDPVGNLSKINFTDAQGKEVMKFFPATSSSKRNARIEYKANFPKDGIYELRVQAKDKSSNMSGDIDYTISFEVINKSTITEVLNYPNPFSTSTRFVFTLTGSEIPSHFKIQIMTVTGKVIKEVSKEELGAIRIGRNITDYAWDGTDNFGDPVGNGVYLYRVLTRINGGAIEHRTTNADQYFHKGFGKMYLMR